MMMKRFFNKVIVFLPIIFIELVFASSVDYNHQISNLDKVEQVMSEIVIYTKKICPYCVRAKDLMDKKGWSYTEIDLDLHPDKIKEMVEMSKRRSVPQIFIKGKHVGGCDDLYDLDANGQLDAFFQ